MTLIDPSLTSTEFLVEQLDALPTGQRIVLILHDDHLTQELATCLATKPDAVYRNVEFRFSPGQIEVRGEIRVLGWRVPATVWGDLRVQDCHIEAPITGLSVGGALTPAFVGDEASKHIQSELERVLGGLFETLPLCLESIEVQDGVAIAEGARQ